MNLKEKLYELREQLKPIGEEINAQVKVSDPAAHDSGETKANIMLAYRHIEDCRMRLGKAVQAFDGGTSVYQR